MGKKKSDITKFKKSYKAGQPIISNRDFEAQVVDVHHDLDKLLQQMDVSDMKIARDLNIPMLLVGFDANQAMATAGTVLHSFINSTVESLRTDLRNVFEPQWINMLIERLMRINGDSMESLISALDSAPPTPPDTSLAQADTPTPTPAPTPPTPTQTTKPKGPIDDLKISTTPEEPDVIKVTDLPFKAKLTFENISVATILDTAATVIGLHKEGLIDLPLALQELDRKNWIPHMTVVAAQKKAEQMALFQQGLAVKQSDLPPGVSKPEDPNTPPPKSESSRGPDAGGKVDNMLQSKLNLSNRSSKSSTGANKQLRSL